MKNTDFLDYNVGRKIYFNNQEYVLSKDSDGFFTINNQGNVVLILSEDKFIGENKLLEAEINNQIFNKQLMEITETIFNNQGKMFKLLIK